MKNYFFLIIGLLWMPTLIPYTPNNCDENTIVTSSENCSGFYGEFTWLYLKSTSTDSDLEVGTLITLTEPPNLFGQLQQLQSKYKSAFRGSLGYFIPCTDWSVDLNYLHYKSDDCERIPSITLNQLIQSFLGGAYSTLNGLENQRLGQANMLFAKRYTVHDCLTLKPYFGLTYTNIKRNLCTTFTGLKDAPEVEVSTLSGILDSKYQGVGPIVGTYFDVSLLQCISLQVMFGFGTTFGKIKSSIQATEINDDEVINFNSCESQHRAVPLLNSQVALVFHPTICDTLDMQLKVGYELDYYFKAVDRINPFNGFVVNQNSFPVKVSSNLGLGGPFITLSLASSGVYDYACGNYCTDSSYTSNCCNYLNGLYTEFTSWWPKALPNNEDLIYATLTSQNNCEQNLQAQFKHSWNGIYKLGYETETDLDFSLSFFRLDENAQTSITAKNGETINSIDASGNAFVDYSAAQSKANYNLNQVDFLAGRYITPVCNLDLLLSCGLRYTSLKRKMNNQYTGGIPALEFESKFACLQSKFHGVGPIFMLKTDYQLCNNFHITGHVSTALLMGRLKSTLDQVNQGTMGQSSNTLRTSNDHHIVPVVDASAGFNYTFCVASKFDITIEAGYKFSDHFRAINLVLADFLTGLQQKNSDLKLHGPYFSIKFGA